MELQAAKTSDQSNAPCDDRSKDNPQKLLQTKWGKVLLTLLLHVANIGFGILVTLPPTFYPSEAEEKGATPSQVQT